MQILDHLFKVLDRLLKFFLVRHLLDDLLKDLLYFKHDFCLELVELVDIDLLIKFVIYSLLFSFKIFLNSINRVCILLDLLFQL